MTVYSNSRLSTFETCPRQYWFAYIEKPEIERPPTVEAFLGSRVHEALEHLYFRLLNGRLLSRDELLDWYEALWQKEWSDDVRIVKADLTADDYRAVGRQCIGDYYERYHPFDQDRTLVLEGQILFNLDADGRHKVRGFIDRLARDRDGRYAIHDYKTSSRLPKQAQADADRQLALYQIGVQGMWDDVQEVDLVWHYLRFGAELRSRRTPEQLVALKAECIALIEDIESRGEDDEDFPTSASRLCDWCDYRELCPVRATITRAGCPSPPSGSASLNLGRSTVPPCRVRHARRHAPVHPALEGAFRFAFADTECANRKAIYILPVAPTQADQSSDKAFPPGVLSAGGATAAGWGGRRRRARRGP